MDIDDFNPTGDPLEGLDLEEDASDIEQEDTPWEEIGHNDSDGEEDDVPHWLDQPIQFVKTPTRNLIRTKPGTTAYSKDANEPLKAFNLFFNEALLDVFLNHTNDRMADEELEPVDKVELQDFIGILIAMGITKQSGTDAHSLWSNKYIGYMPVFAGSMARDRFCQIFRKLRFDDKNTRESRKANDKLAAISEVTQILSKACWDSYITGTEVTVDEGITPFRGRCKFRVYMPNKPNRYGIKNWILADAKMRYVKNFTVYTGKEGNAITRDLGKKVVLQLTQGLESGRNVTCDNFFTSYSLANELAKKKITLLGTIRKQRKEVPKSMLADNQRAVDSSKYLFTNLATMVSYVPKKNKAVILLSSTHVQFSQEELNATGKPRIVLDYNATKGGVDTIDQMRNEYTVSRPTRRWTMAQFMFYIDIAAINALAIWSEITKSKIKRSEFLWQLVYQLIGPYSRRRMQHGFSGLHRETQEAIKKVFFTIYPNEEPMSQSSSQASASSQSASEKSKKGNPIYCNSCKIRTRKRCSKCSKPCCDTHSQLLCSKCTE